METSDENPVLLEQLVSLIQDPQGSKTELVCSMLRDKGDPALWDALLKRLCGNALLVRPNGKYALDGQFLKGNSRLAVPQILGRAPVTALVMRDLEVLWAFVMFPI